MLRLQPASWCQIQYNTGQCKTTMKQKVEFGKIKESKKKALIHFHRFGRTERLQQGAVHSEIEGLIIIVQD